MRLGLPKRTVSLLTVVSSTGMSVWSRALSGQKINAVLKEASSEETPKPTAHLSRAPHGVHAESKTKPRGSFHFSPNLLSAKGSYKHLHWGEAAAVCRGSARDRKDREYGRQEQSAYLSQPRARYSRRKDVLRRLHFQV